MDPGQSRPAPGRRSRSASFLRHYELFHARPRRQLIDSRNPARTWSSRYPTTLPLSRRQRNSNGWRAMSHYHYQSRHKRLLHCSKRWRGRSPSKTRPSDARPAFTCIAAAADFPFPVHPHMPTHACGVPSQNQQKTQPKLVIVFRRAIFDPRRGLIGVQLPLQSRRGRQTPPPIRRAETVSQSGYKLGRFPAPGETPTDGVFGRDRER